MKRVSLGGALALLGVLTSFPSTSWSWVAFPRAPPQSRRHERTTRRAAAASTLDQVRQKQKALSENVKKIGPPYPARPYQEQAAAFFFQAAAKAVSERRALTFEMACGTGKTYVMGMIIAQDLVNNPSAQYVIFVPWRDLARQVYSELVAFGLTVGVVGDGSRQEDSRVNVYVCVYMSAEHVREKKFRIKFVDEAHRLQNSEAGAGTLRTIRHYMPAEITAFFSATFRPGVRIDFHYPLKQAVADGYVSDFEVTVPLLGRGSKLNAIAKFVSERIEDYAPILLCYGSVKQAQFGAKALNNYGVEAVAADSKMSHASRKELIDDFSAGKIKAICVCRLFNEGTSIDELKTVLFANARKCPISAQQLAMRVTRKGESKRFQKGNVVVALGVEDSDATMYELQEMVQTLTAAQTGRAIDGAKPAKQSRARLVWFQHVKHDGPKNDIVDLDAKPAELLTVHTFDRSGGQLAAPTSGSALEVASERYKAWYAKHLRRPDLDSEDWEEASWSNWLFCMQIKSNQGLLSNDELRMMLDVPEYLQLVMETPRTKLKDGDYRLLLIHWTISNPDRAPSERSDDLFEQRLSQWLLKKRKWWARLKYEGFAMVEEETFWSQITDISPAVKEMSKHLLDMANEREKAMDALRRYIQQETGCPCEVRPETLDTWVDKLRRRIENEKMTSDLRERMQKTPELWERLL